MKAAGGCFGSIVELTGLDAAAVAGVADAVADILTLESSQEKKLPTLARSKTISYSDGTPTVTRTYDNQTVGANGKGRLWTTQTSGNAGMLSTTDTYDALGRPLTAHQQFYMRIFIGKGEGCVRALGCTLYACHRRLNPTHEPSS